MVGWRPRQVSGLPVEFGFQPTHVVFLDVRPGTADPQIIFAGTGTPTPAALFPSIDGGQTWESINGAIPNPDVPNVAVAEGLPKTVVVVVNNEVYTSDDEGANWNSIRIRQVFLMTYPRGILVQPGHPNVILVTIGDSTPGRIGTVMRSKDTGKNQELGEPASAGRTRHGHVGSERASHQSPGRLCREPLRMSVPQ